ncbi:MAG: ABC transporter permease [Chlamydiales bacterium]
MLIFALKMMVGDRAKFIGIVIGLTFATFIITQQAGIFTGLMQRTYGFITDTSQPNIWVMDKQVLYVDDVKPMKETKLYQVRSIEGVAWAVPMFKGALYSRLPSGNFQTCNVIGIDDATLIGGPPRMLEGKIENLRNPDAVIVNDVGTNGKLAAARRPGGPILPLGIGETFEINDLRASVQGICSTSRTFDSLPVIYTLYERALHFTPTERNLMSFILVRSEENQNTAQLCRRIAHITGLAAYTDKEFKKLTIKYYLLHTGIPINFGVAVFLGFIIGTAIAGQTFYNFTHDNLRYFATYKAMGATHKVLIRMVLVQGLMTAALGWGLGIGLTALFGFSSGGTELSYTLPWWLLLASGLSILSITLLAALISIYKILHLQPSIVFQS